MIRKLCFLTLFLPAFSFLTAQTVSYDDVGVIVNTNSPASVAVGNYFMSERNIPVQNLIQISAPVQETIDSTQMTMILNQINAYLAFSQLDTSLNYLVTTKGVPLRVSVNGACDSSFTNPGGCTAFDSELALLRSGMDSLILKPSGVMNPFYNSDSAFSRDQYSMFLVSRLDGYSKADAMALVDKGGPGIVANMPNTQFILDYADLNGSDISYLQSIHSVMESDLTGLGWTVQNDTQNTSGLTGENGVLGLNGWFRLGTTAAPGHNWAPGAFVHVWEGDMTLTMDSVSSGQYLNLPTVLREGAACGAAYSSPTYASLALHAYEFFPAFYDSTNGQNLAECFYRSLVQLSQQAILIGDPKMSILPDPLMSVEPPAELGTLLIYPNPAKGMVNLRIPENAGMVQEISLISLEGRLVRRFEGSLNSGTDMQLDLQGLPSGMYILQVKAGDRPYTARISLMP